MYAHTNIAVKGYIALESSGENSHMESVAPWRVGAAPETATENCDGVMMHQRIAKRSSSECGVITTE